MPLLFCRHLDRRIDWKVTLPDGDFTIGCSETASVPVPDATLSPREVLIAKKGDRYLLQDLAERGQVVFGGAVTRTGLLKDGDRFRVGRVSMLFIENLRQDSGQIELHREAMPTLDLLDNPVPALAVRSPERKIPDEVEIPRGVWVGVLVLAIFTGMCLGVLFTGGGATESAASSSPGNAIETAIARARAEGPAPAKGPEERRRLADAPNRPSTLAPPTATQATATVKPVPPSRFQLQAPPPPPSSRLLMFRLFLDLAGRPPTRSEEKELAALDFDQLWQRLVATATREGTIPDLKATVEAQFFLFIGRKPTGEEAQEVTGMVTSERPALYWIAQHDEYRRPERRRPRSPSVRARSLIVDVLDRAPTDGEEVETVRAALSGTGPGAGSTLESVRTLAYSEEGRRLGNALGDNWQAEAFRFLLRPLSVAEETNLSAAWAQADGKSRGAWLLIALATQQDYGQY